MKQVLYSNEYREIWDKFCKEQPEAWFWHTSFWMEYCLESRFGVECQNFSYLIMDDKLGVLAIVPLIMELSGEGREFSYSSGPLPEPLILSNIGKKEKEIEKYIFAEYKRLAKVNNVQRIAIRLSNMCQTQEDRTEPVLIRYGYIDISGYTSVLNLQHNEEYLLAGMTKGHRSSITKAIRLGVEVKSYDQLTITEEKWRDFKESYFNAAKKHTRPDTTFELLFRFIQNGHGYLFESFEKAQWSGFIYILVYKSYAYYAMSCRNSEETTVANSQIIQWEVIKWLKKRNVKLYELGEQYFTPSFFYPVDSKMIAISQHKRGFGGILIPQVSGEYYFSQEYFAKVWNSRYNKFYAYISEGCEISE